MIICRREFLVTSLAAPAAFAQSAALEKITVNYPTRTAQVWPLYIAKEAKYFEKYGLDVNLVFGVHPAGIAMLVSGEGAMTVYTLEQSMQAASKDGSLVALASPFKKSLFALMSQKGIASVKELKGKRIGVSQIGDAPYNYTLGLLARAGLGPRDVTWIPMGSDVTSRLAGLVGNRVDATMLTAPSYFKLEGEGFRNLGNISDYEEIYAPSVSLFKKATAAQNPGLAERLIKAQAEGVKRFYDDKAFAVSAYLTWDKQNRAEMERVYDQYKKTETYERIPYIPAAAIQYVLDHPSDEKTAAQLRAFDFHQVMDNSLVTRLVREGFFEKLFGPGIKSEQERKAKLAYR